MGFLDKRPYGIMVITSHYFLLEGKWKWLENYLLVVKTIDCQETDYVMRVSPILIVV